MTNSFTQSQAVTFTLTHARHLAAKVATDLKRMQRFYGAPSDTHINELEEELVALLKNGYLKAITYGFKRDGKFIVPSLYYTAHELLTLNTQDDDPGKVLPGADVSNAHFNSYLERSQAYFDASDDERNAFNQSIDIQRVGIPKPEAEGYFSKDLTYSSGGRSLNRSTLKSY
jgi:hypothetical protein